MAPAQTKRLRHRINQFHENNIYSVWLEQCFIGCASVWLSHVIYFNAPCGKYARANPFDSDKYSIMAA